MFEIKATLDKCNKLLSEGEFDNALSFTLSVLEKNDLSKRDFAVIQSKRGECLVKLGKHEEVLNLAKKTLAEIENLGFTAIELGFYNQMISTQWRLGQFEKALKTYEICEQIVNSLGENLSREVIEAFATIKMNKAGVYYFQGKLKEVQIILNDCLKLFEELDDKEGISKVLNNLGLVIQEQGELNEALKIYERTLDLYIVLDRKQEQGVLLTNIGRIYYDKGEFDLALAYQEKSLVLLKKYSSNAFIAYPVTRFGDTYYAKGDYER